jgi:IS5 family transposase
MRQRCPLTQISFAKTYREMFLEETERVVPRKVLLKIIEPHYPVAGCGRRPYALGSMVRVHLMQNWVGLSGPAVSSAC